MVAVYHLLSRLMPQRDAAWINASRVSFFFSSIYKAPRASLLKFHIAVNTADK